jgi:hypothetical protein
MQRMLLLWSLFLGLALVGADAYIERGRASALPSYEGGTPSASVMGAPAGGELWEDGTPIPPPK